MSDTPPISLPQCCVCKHWTNNPLLGGREGKPDRGACMLTVMGDNAFADGKRHRAVANGDGRSAWLETHANFACSQFERGVPYRSSDVPAPLMEPKPPRGRVVPGPEFPLNRAVEE